MVYPSLTAAQMKKSQLFLIGFNLLNGTLTFALSNAIAPFLWKICDHFLGPDLNMTRYRMFFLLALPFIGFGFIGMWRQKEV